MHECPTQDFFVDIFLVLLPPLPLQIPPLTPPPPPHHNIMMNRNRDLLVLQCTYQDQDREDGGSLKKWHSCKECWKRRAWMSYCPSCKTLKKNFFYAYQTYGSPKRPTIGQF